MNFDGPNAGPVREFFQANAAYWISEFHLDGLRLDATQDIFDASSEHILIAIARTARRAAGDRRLFLVAENEPQDSSMLRLPGDGGTAWTPPATTISTTPPSWRPPAAGRRTTATTAAHHRSSSPASSGATCSRGSTTSGSPSTVGCRHSTSGPAASCTTSTTTTRSATRCEAGRLPHPPAPVAAGADALPGPGVRRLQPLPVLRRPRTGLARPGVRSAGRAEHLRQFPSAARALEAMPDPGEPVTFARCHLDHRERKKHAATLELHRDLLHLRRHDLLLARPEVSIDGAVPGHAARLGRRVHRHGRPVQQTRSPASGLPQPSICGPAAELSSSSRMPTGTARAYTSVGLDAGPGVVKPGGRGA